MRCTGGGVTTPMAFRGGLATPNLAFGVAELDLRVAVTTLN
jgi:hypothetical protein